MVNLCKYVQRERSRDRGFTLVEICVAAAVLSVIMYVLYSMFVTGIRSFRQSEGKTESLEYGILAYEMIAQDCRRSVFHGIPSDANVLPCFLPPDKKSVGFVTFHSMDFLSSNLPKALREKVLYSLVPSGHGYGYLSRNGKVYKSIKISNMEFDVIDGARADGKLQRYLSIKITGYGNRPQDEQLFIGLIAFDSYNLRQIHPYFVEYDRLLQGDF
jgi:prepilin-type N-terminal cleavage/methylation domain-containing protein